MKKSSLYGHAAEVVSVVRGGHRAADSVIADFFRDRRYLGARDRREISTMVFGTIRHYRLLEHLVRRSGTDTVSSDAAISRRMSCLLIAAYVLHIAKDAESDTVQALNEFMTSWFGGTMPDGILDRLLAAGSADEGIADPVRRIGVAHSFPDSIVEEWVRCYGETEAEELAAALNHQAPLSIRVNTLRGTVDQCRDALAGAGIQAERGALSPFALVLPRRIALDVLQPYRDGWFEMQDEGSQVLSLLLHPTPGTIVIDACAGGGGKTLHIAALMENRGRLVAIDIDDRKLQSLAKRAERANATVHAVLSAKRDEAAMNRLRGKAQAVLVDAPCSAIGTVRRNPSLKMTYTRERSSQLSAMQNDLLETAAEWVAPGGRLVYSTCTLLVIENEDVVSRFLQRHSEFTIQSAHDILGRWGITVDHSSPYLRLFPHRSGTDGFFAAALVKNETGGASR
jgi:16S rRNA (cytosine967-C5)-methyltransferase